MEGTYDVILGNRKMGTVTVTKQGLYYYFFCQCKLSGETMQELVLQRGDQTWKLGLLTPANGAFGLRTKIAAKHLGQGSPSFFLRPRHSTMEGAWIPLHPEEPFRYLQRLQQAHLVKHGSQIGILLQDVQEG